MSAQTIQSLLCVLVSLITAGCFGLLYVIIARDNSFVIDVIRDVFAECLLRRRFGIYALPALYCLRFNDVVSLLALGGLVWGLWRSNPYGVSVATALLSFRVLDGAIRFALLRGHKISLPAPAPVVDAEFEA